MCEKISRHVTLLGRIVRVVNEELLQADTA